MSGKRVPLLRSQVYGVRAAQVQPRARLQVAGAGAGAGAGKKVFSTRPDTEPISDDAGRRFFVLHVTGDVPPRRGEPGHWRPDSGDTFA